MCTDEYINPKCSVFTYDVYISAGWPPLSSALRSAGVCAGISSRTLRLTGNTISM